MLVEATAVCNKVHTIHETVVDGSRIKAGMSLGEALPELHPGGNFKIIIKSFCVTVEIFYSESHEPPAGA